MDLSSGTAFEILTADSTPRQNAINKIVDMGWYGIPWYLLYQAREEVVNCETVGVTVDKSRYSNDIETKII